MTFDSTYRLRPVASALTVVLSGMLACSSASTIDLPHFHDVVDAPSAIQKAARAVVRVSTSDGVATGSFISDSGLLLTNNHVLGAPVCPIEGCYAEISFSHEVGQKPSQPQIVFAVPVAVDVGLDVATVQLFASRGGPTLSTPDHLSLRPERPSSLVGMHITVVGHPEGRLKKWTDGTVFDWSGDWFQSSAYVLPGDSGSPVLDDDGKLVGIVHRSPNGEDLITSDSVNVSSIGTASASISSAMSAPLPQVMISATAATTASDVVANDMVYLNGRVSTVTLASGPAQILGLLGDACDAALQRQDFLSPGDLASALAPCGHAITWIECRADASPVPYGVVCPAATEAAAWANRFQAMNRAWQSMNGALDLFSLSFGVAHLATSTSAGRSAGAQSLQQALAAASPTLDFGLANYLAAFGVSSYAGQDVPSYVMSYSRVPHYEFQATSIASAAGWLYEVGLVPRAQMLSVWSGLAADRRVSVGSKLYVQELQYSAGAL